MRITQASFLDLVARASTFWERLEPPFVPVVEPLPQQALHARIERWKTVARKRIGASFCGGSNGMGSTKATHRHA